MTSTKKLTSLAAGTLALAAGVGLGAASPALATTRPAPHTATTRHATSTHGASYTTSYRTTYRSTSSGTSSSTSSSTSSASSTSTSSTTTTSTTTGTLSVTTTGSCPLGSSTTGTSCNTAIAFMLAQKNSGSTAWHNRCLGIVSRAYGNVYTGYGTAASAAAAVSASGLMHHTTDLASIPRGAVVWFANSGAGHVVISLGNGYAISSDVANGSIGTSGGGVGIVPISYFISSWHQTLIGWSAPRA